ncbi:AarF/UbiB family protein [Streptomyces sp. NPDC003077]|uniref:ABC1 kinase family protein n=1 Tax=Streptomyces sp. NPDC003077 TaxID=3154443 RepID=UPI0033B36457
MLAGLAGREASVVLRPRGAADGDRREGAVRRARSVREALESLGPFYIKVGQMLATRPDIVPQTMIDEFEKLQDKVSELPFRALEPVLADELGPGWRRGFREIDTDRPLGTASLSQVYRGVLSDGQPVAVKIQRPGVRAVMEEDMALLRKLSRFAARRAPRFNEVVDIEAMLGVVFDAMLPELDFVLEARNMERARKVADGFKHIAVPEVLTARPRVLVQSLAPGRPIREADPTAFDVEERKAIGRDLLAFMYRGYFLERTFHADPHPGNVFVSPGEKATLIDWGMVGRIDRPMSGSILLTLLNLAMNDGAGTARAWIDMGGVTSRARVSAFAEDMAGLVPRVATASLEDLNFGVTLTAVLQYSTRRGIRTSPMVSMLGKSFANIEGSIRNLCPELSLTEVFSEELSHIVLELLREAFSSEQVMRTALEVVAGGTTAAQQLRGAARDLVNRDFAVQVAVQETGRGGLGGIRLGAREVLFALAGAAWWQRRTRRA